jgi:hypothetical protein
MTFNIGSQTAGVINNVSGDQRITGGQQGTVVTSEAASMAVQDLRKGVASVPFDQAAASQAHAHVKEIEAAMQSAEPDQPRVARSLTMLTRLLLAVHGLGAAGSAVLASVQTIAGWLGALGQPILGLLPALA